MSRASECGRYLCGLWLFRISMLEFGHKFAGQAPKRHVRYRFRLSIEIAFINVVCDFCSQVPNIRQKTTRAEAVSAFFENQILCGKTAKKIRSKISRICFKTKQNIWRALHWSNHHWFTMNILKINALLYTIKTSHEFEWTMSSNLLKIITLKIEFSFKNSYLCRFDFGLVCMCSTAHCSYCCRFYWFVCVQCTLHSAVVAVDDFFSGILFVSHASS